MPEPADIESGGYIQVIPEESERASRLSVVTERTEPYVRRAVSQTTMTAATGTRTGTSATSDTSKFSKTVKTVGLISLIGTGAGLLANGVKSLFDGSLKAKRQERKAARAAEKAQKAAAAKAALSQAAQEALSGGQGVAASGTFVQTGGAPAGGAMQMGDIGEFLKKNWMVVAVIVLVLFGGKLFKPKRTYRRRSTPRTRTVYRYRTRKPATRRRR